MSNSLLKQASTARALYFLMVDSADHITGKTGLSPTVTLCKEGGSFGVPAGDVSEVAYGWYKVDGNATDTGTLGSLLLHATGTAADPVDLRFDVVAFDPQAATNLGLSYLSGSVALDSTVAKDSTVSKPGTAQTISSNADIAAIKAKTDLLAFSAGAVQADLQKIAGVATVDGVTLTAWFESILAHAAGDVVRSVNTYDYKKQDGVTTLFSFTSSAGGRS